MYENNPNKAQNFTKKISVLQNLNRDVRVQNYILEAQERTFAERYTALYFLGVALAFIAQCASAWSSYAKVESFIKFKIENPDVLFAVVLFCLLVVEVLKYFLVHTCLRDMYALRPIYPYPLMVCAFCMSCFSTWLSVSGSSELAKDNKQEKALTSEQAGKEKGIKAEIEKIRDTDTYKSIVWDGAGKTSKILNDEGKALVKKREAELDSLRKTYQLKTQNFQATQASNQTTFNWVFGIFEVLFLLLTVGAHYYKRQCAIEAILQSKAPNPEGEFSNEQHFEADSPSGLGALQRTVKQNTSNSPENPLYSELYSSAKNLTELLNEPLDKFDPTPNLEETKSENEVDTERLFQELLAKYSNGSAAYLRKYQKAVETILKLRIQKLATSEIEKKVCAKFKFSPSTFYGILRVIDNTKTE
jgi:hypothetical protein